MTSLIPCVDWMRDYRKDWLRLDLAAGVTTAAVVIPKSMAFGSIAGLPVEIGLYAALLPMLLYAFLGTSRILSVSSTATLAILVAAQLRMAVPGGDRAMLLTAVATLTMLTGAILLVASTLRLGFLANLISDPVLAGFKMGIGLVIVVDQAPKLLGLHIAKEGFFRDLGALALLMPDSHLPTILVGVTMLAVLFVLEHFAPKAPAPLIAAVLGILGAWLLPLKTASVALTGPIPRGIPIPTLPNLELVGVLWPGAMAIALMSFTESVAAARAFARPGDPRPNANQELRALGLANLAGSLLPSIPAGGGTSQTAVNARAGACTQAAQWVTVGVVLAVLFLLAPAVSLLPQATLAAIVVATSIPLLNPRELRAIGRVRFTEFWWGIVALVGVVVLGTLPGILIAVAVSLLTLVYQANRPPLYVIGRRRGTETFAPVLEDPDVETFPGLLIIRTEGRMTFASAPQLAERVWELIHKTRPRVLVLECSAIPDFEYTALKGLAGFEQRLKREGVTFWLAGLNAAPRKVIARSPLGPALGEDRCFNSIVHAVHRYHDTNATSSLASDPLSAIASSNSHAGDCK